MTNTARFSSLLHLKGAHYSTQLTETKSRWKLPMLMMTVATGLPDQLGSLDRPCDEVLHQLPANCFWSEPEHLRSDTVVQFGQVSGAKFASEVLQMTKTAQDISQSGLRIKDVEKEESAAAAAGGHETDDE